MAQLFLHESAALVSRAQMVPALVAVSQAIGGPSRGLARKARDVLELEPEAASLYS